MASETVPFRTRIKRGVKQLFARLAPPDNQPGVVILAYHSVGSKAQSELNVPLDLFRRQMAFLRQNRQVVSLSEALHLAQNGLLDEDVVVLTFDDGYRNVYTHAYPVLKALGLPATVYVCPSYVETGSPLPWGPTQSVMDWNMLRALTSDGLITVGSHTWSHRVLPTADDRELEFELIHAQETIEDRLQRAAPDFCYPKALWDERCSTAVRKHYATAVVGGHRKQSFPVNPLCLSRIPVLLSDTLPLFEAKLAGRLSWEGSLSRGRDLCLSLTGRLPVR